MAGADLRRRVVITCGFCLEKWTPSSVKSPVTGHRIVREEFDKELEMRKQTIECCRCGTRSEHYPRKKGKSRSQIQTLKQKRKTFVEKKRKLKKAARVERINKGASLGEK